MSFLYVMSGKKFSQQVVDEGTPAAWHAELDDMFPS
jgi:hypothetical protein